MRTLLAWLLGIAGIAAVGYGTFKPWHDGRTAAELPMADLFAGIQAEPAALIASLAVPLLVGGAVALVGLLLSTTALRVGSVVLLAVVLGWFLRFGGFDGLQVGFWNAAFGTLLVLVAAAVKP